MGDIEFTLTRCKAIETLLVKRFGATGQGLHEKISSVENLLPPNVVKQGRYIATIRNKITHDANYQTLDDRDRFIRACNEVEAALQNYQPGTQQNFNQGQQFFSENNREISVNLNEHFRTITNRSAIRRNFVFYLEKNAFGIKILTRKGRLISIIFGRVIFAFIQLIVLGFILGAISENIQEFNFLAIALIGITVICFLTLLSIRSSLINITIAPNYIYVGRRKYERRGETVFYIFSENMNRNRSGGVEVRS